MNNRYIDSLVLVLTLPVGSAIAAEKIAVIVNAKNTQTLLAADVKNIYKDNVITWSSGAPISVYDLPVKSEFRETFSQRVLGTSARDAATEWANKKITNSAKNPPTTKPDAVVISNVASEPGAIGYVSADAVAGKEGIRVVLTIE